MIKNKIIKFTLGVYVTIFGAIASVLTGIGFVITLALCLIWCICLLALVIPIAVLSMPLIVCQSVFEKIVKKECNQERERKRKCVQNVTVRDARHS
jgi:fatty acid desaturase